jgi:O-antigen ligase
MPPFIGIRTDMYLYLGWFFYLLLSGKSKNIKLSLQDNFFLFWIFWLSLSLLANGLFFEKFNPVILNYLKWFCLFILLSRTLTSTRQVKIFCILLIVFAVILSVEGFYHYFSKDGLGWAGQSLGWIDSGGKGRTRWISIFDGPGVFCVVYTIALPFIMPLWNKGSSFFRKAFFIILFGLFAAAIYVNGSRGGLLTAMAILLMYFGPNYFKKNKFLFVILIVGVLGAFAALPSYMTQLSDEHHSSAHRVEMWAEGCEMLKQNPVFGIGRGRFAAYTGELVAHNSFVEIMGETGLPGLFAWMALIYFSLKQLYCYIKENIDQDENTIEVILSRCLFISIIGYLISAMFVTLEYETFYMLLAVCFVFGRQLKAPLEMTGKDFKMIISIEAAWVIFINLFTLLLGPSAFS